MPRLRLGQRHALPGGMTGELEVAGEVGKLFDFGGEDRGLLGPATLRRHASLRTCQYVNVLAFVAARLTHGPRPSGPPRSGR